MLQWFKTHPEFLRTESTALSSDSNYKQLYQFRDNLFVSHGNIIVRINGTHRFPILIVYTNATPYRLPLVFPLTRNLSEQAVRELSCLDIFDLLVRIRPVVKFYYHLRHQNSSGELCTLERADLDGPSTFYGITTILQRVRDWCAGHLTNSYPPDSEEVNFEAHFNFISDDTKLFYPDTFLDTSLTEGDCYASLYRIVSKGIYFKEDRYVYTGCFIDGISKTCLIQQPTIDLSHCALHENIRSSLDIYTQTGIVQNLIAERQLLKSHWFHLDSEPMPFEKFSDLVSIIGNSDYQRGLKRLTTRCLESFQTMPDFFYLAIRFANRKGSYEFQLFKVLKIVGKAYEGVGEKDPVKKMQFILDRYDRVEAVSSEKLSAESFHQRNGKRAEYQALKDAFVNIMGVGAIGSEIADSINKAGIGNVVLFDDQTIKVHNAVRHLAGIEYLGIPKVTAVHNILYNHNPFAKIYPIPLNLYTLDVPINLQDGSLSVCSVADDNVEGFINQQLVINGKPAFYARALRGGKTARIFRVIPGQDACFHCLSLYREDKKDFIEIPEDPDFPVLMNECNNPIRPASAADLKLIAAIASRIVIDHLQNGPSSTNHWIWSNDAIELTPITAANQLHEQNLPPHPGCPYCYHDIELKVMIDNSCLTFMQSLIKKDPTIETGGVMAGFVDSAGNIKVSHVSGPGPKAIQSATKFEKDVQFCQQFLDELYAQQGEKAIYVGEWHSHPSVNNRPSGTDIKSLSQIAVEKNYLTTCPAMIIFSNTGKPSCTLHPAGKRFYYTNLIILNNK